MERTKLMGVISSGERLLGRFLARCSLPIHGFQNTKDILE